MAQDIDNAIRQSAQGPASAEADGVKVTQHRPTEQIAADKHVAARDAMRRNPARGFVRVKIVPPGTV